MNKLPLFFVFLISSMLKTSEYFWDEPNMTTSTKRTCSLGIEWMCFHGSLIWLIMEISTRQTNLAAKKKGMISLHASQLCMKPCNCCSWSLFEHYLQRICLHYNDRYYSKETAVMCSALTIRSLKQAKWLWLHVFE